MSRHVVVLGASGFVGAALTTHLRQRADLRVTALRRPEFDLVDAASFGAIPEDADVIVHAAGPVGGEHGEDVLWNTNVIATHALVRALNTRKCPVRLLYLSTGGVVGGRRGITPADAPPAPSGVYALSKYLGEEIIRTTATMPWCIARLYFPYGPGQATQRLVPSLVERIASGDAVTLNRDGLPRLSLVYIDDLVAQLEKMIDENATGVRSIAGATCTSVGELVEAIASLLGQTPAVTRTDAEPPDYCAPDNLEVPQTSLTSGLAAVVARRQT